MKPSRPSGCSELHLDLRVPTVPRRTAPRAVHSLGGPLTTCTGCGPAKTWDPESLTLCCFVTVACFASMPKSATRISRADLQAEGQRRKRGNQVLWRIGLRDGIGVCNLEPMHCPPGDCSWLFRPPHFKPHTTLRKCCYGGAQGLARHTAVPHTTVGEGGGGTPHAILRSDSSNGHVLQVVEVGFGEDLQKHRIDLEPQRSGHQCNTCNSARGHAQRSELPHISLRSPLA